MPIPALLSDTIRTAAPECAATMERIKARPAMADWYRKAEEILRLNDAQNAYMALQALLPLVQVQGAGPLLPTTPEEQEHHRQHQETVLDFYRLNSAYGRFATATQLVRGPVDQQEAARLFQVAYTAASTG